MKVIKSRKSQNFQNLEKKEKSQNFGLKMNRNPQKRFFFRKESKDYVVYDSLTSEIYFVNKTSKIIIRLYERGYKEDWIINSLSNEYPFINRNQIKRDIQPLIEILK